MDIQREFDIHLRSRHTFLFVVSHEEERIKGDLAELCKKSKRQLFSWDLADHFQALHNPAKKILPAAKDPITALEAIEKFDGEGVFVLPDFHRCLDKQPRVTRKIRNLVQKLKYTKKSVVVISPSVAIPEELKDSAVIVDIPPPSFTELEEVLDHLLTVPGVKSKLDEQQKERLIRAALGLSTNQAQRVFAKAIVCEGVLDERDIVLINHEKKQIIRESGALEFYAPTESLGDVGGLEALKQWVDLRETAFSNEAREYGLPAPKGIALIGIPGTGKSLSAKVIASRWRLPLVRLDIGALFGSLVGQSEENTRKALMLAETISPCVLWIDELEKALATQGGGGDSGTSMRVFGTILSWMQEKKHPVFVIATANNVAMLPPELLRRGRFDEIFFLDLPTSKEREAIFKVHIKKRGRSVDNFELSKLISATEGFVGAEIEQAIIDAMYIAFNDQKNPKREFTSEDILLAADKLVPMSRAQKEQIEHLRRWLHEGRAQSASFEEKSKAEAEFVPIQVESL